MKTVKDIETYYFVLDSLFGISNTYIYYLICYTIKVE